MNNYLPLRSFIWSLLLLILLTACGSEAPATSPYASQIANNNFPSGEAANGQTMFNQRVIGSQGAPGCMTCHAPEIVLVGPPQNDLITLATETLDNPNYTGQATTVEGYLWESVVNPSVYVTEGYANVMYKEYADRLTEQEIADLVAYMLALE